LSGELGGRQSSSDFDESCSAQCASGRRLTANVVLNGNWPTIEVVFFSFETDLAGGEGSPADRNFAGDGQRRALTPVLILVIALPETKDNGDPG
jgi:hypothetical protein